MFGRLQLSLQLFFGLFNVPVDLLSLLLLHLVKSFPARRVFKLKCPRLGEMWWLLSFPEEEKDEDEDENNHNSSPTRQPSQTE